MDEVKVIYAADDQVTSWTRYICFRVADNDYEGKLYWDVETGYELNLSLGDYLVLELDVPDMNDWYETLNSLSYDSQLAREIIGA